MKTFFKENLLRILSFILLSLLLILWGRMISKEIKENTYSQNLWTQEARLSCLKHFGWEVDPASECIKDFAIPNPLDAAFLQYNKLQAPLGLNLEPYRGEKAICYTYLAMNFPYETDEPVYINLMIYEGSLIAGDCTSDAIDGLILPLDRRLFP